MTPVQDFIGKLIVTAMVIGFFWLVYWTFTKPEPVLPSNCSYQYGPGRSLPHKVCR